MKLALIIGCLLLLTSCSTSTKYKTTVDIDDKEVVQKFELSKEILKKFSNKQESVVQQTKQKPKVKRKKKKDSYKKKMKKVVSKKQKQTKKIAKVVEKKNEPVRVDEEDEEVIAPSRQEGYPEKFVLFDKKSEKIWDQYKENIFIGEKSKLEVSYLGATAGHIEIETLPLTSLNGQEVYHFKALVKTAKYYSFIYWVNDTLHSYVEREGFLPIKYVLSQREKKQDIDDLQLFDREKLKTIFFYRKVKNGKTIKKEVTEDIPFFFQDSFSSIQFMRGLPLKVGASFEYPVVNKAKYWTLKVKVLKKETLDIMDQDIEAYKVAAETQFPGALKKTGDIFFWFSTDSTHRLLKFEGKVKIGSLAGELIHYQAGTKL